MPKTNRDSAVEPIYDFAAFPDAIPNRVVFEGGRTFDITDPDRVVELAPTPIGRLSDGPLSEPAEHRNFRDDVGAGYSPLGTCEITPEGEWVCG